MQAVDAGFDVVVHEGDGDATTIAGTFETRFMADDLMQRLLAEGKVVSITQNGTIIVPRRGTTTT